MRTVVLRIVLALGLMVGGIASANAQQTVAQLLNAIATQLPTNGAGSIAAANLRSVLNSIVNSSINYFGGRTKLTGSTTFYANYSTGTDASGCGLAVGSPCKTVNYLYNNLLVPNYDTAGQSVTLSFAANDPTCVLIGTAWTGSGQVTIQGPGGSPPSVGLTCGTIAIGINAPLPAALFLSGFKISGGTIGIFSQAPGLIVINNINFGAESQYQINLAGPGSKLLCPGSGGYTVSGPATYHWLSNSPGALISGQSCAVTLAGTPAFAIFAVATDGGGIQPGTSYSGSATGVRFAVNASGFIDSGTGNVNLLPGNSAGVVGTAGYYN
jgi:hypothetical protein